MWDLGFMVFLVSVVERTVQELAGGGGRPDTKLPQAAAAIKAEDQLPMITGEHGSGGWFDAAIEIRAENDARVQTEALFEIFGKVRHLFVAEFPGNFLHGAALSQRCVGGFEAQFPQPLAHAQSLLFLKMPFNRAQGNFAESGKFVRRKIGFFSQFFPVQGMQMTRHWFYGSTLNRRVCFRRPDNHFVVLRIIMSQKSRRVIAGVPETI
jgi:hypothetical protein